MEGFGQTTKVLTLHSRPKFESESAEYKSGTLLIKPILSVPYLKMGNCEENKEKNVKNTFWRNRYQKGRTE